MSIFNRKKEAPKPQLPKEYIWRLMYNDVEREFKCLVTEDEVITFEDMKAMGTMAAAKAKGLVRSEGKEYIMKDGDIVNFLFNV